MKTVKIIFLITTISTIVWLGHKIHQLNSKIKSLNSKIETLLDYEFKENEFIQKNFDFVNKHTKSKFLTIRILKSVYKYSQLYNLDPKLILSLIAIESNFDPNAISKKGAIGLTQILPETAELIAKMLNRFFYDLKDIEDNIEFCCAYLSILKNYSKNEKEMLQKYFAGRDFNEKPAIIYAQKIFKVYQNITNNSEQQ